MDYKIIDLVKHKYKTLHCESVQIKVQKYKIIKQSINNLRGRTSLHLGTNELVIAVHFTQLNNNYHNILQAFLRTLRFLRPFSFPDLRTIVPLVWLLWLGDGGPKAPEK